MEYGLSWSEGNGWSMSCHGMRARDGVWLVME